MKAVYVQEGEAIDYTPGSATAAGSVVVIGQLVGITKLNIAANELGALATEGVFSVEKNAATVANATAGYAVGTGTVEADIEAWKLITDGEFALSINGAAFDVKALDFSGAADLTAVAALIAAGIKGNTGGGASFTAATVVFADDQFTITSGTTGATSKVTALTAVAGGDGTNILATAGFDEVVSVDGQAAVADAKITKGAAVYWDAVSGKLTATVGSNVRVGTAIEAATTEAERIQILLNA